MSPYLENVGGLVGTTMGLLGLFAVVVGCCCLLVFGLLMVFAFFRWLSMLPCWLLHLPHWFYRVFF